MKKVLLLNLIAMSTLLAACTVNNAFSHAQSSSETPSIESSSSEVISSSSESSSSSSSSSEDIKHEEENLTISECDSNDAYGERYFLIVRKKNTLLQIIGPKKDKTAIRKFASNFNYYK